MQERLHEILSSFEGRSHELIPILQRVQREFGYLQEDAMREVAQFVGVPESRVYAVATFYVQFRLTPIGRKHVMVCRGTSCHVRGRRGSCRKSKNSLESRKEESPPTGSTRWRPWPASGPAVYRPAS